MNQQMNEQMNQHDRQRKTIPTRRLTRREYELELAGPFFAVLCIMTIIAFLIPLRPETSMRERRTLKEFPTFRVDAVLSGEYFDDITAWFSDTFPGRETMLDISDGLKSLHGISQNEVVLNQGTATNDNADLDMLLEQAEAEAASRADEKDAQAAPTPEPSYAPADPNAVIETWEGLKGEDEADMYGDLVVIDGTALSKLGFDQNAADHHVALVNAAGNALAQKGIRFFNLPAPTSISVLLSSDMLSQLGSADQGKTLRYMFALENDNVYKVNAFNNMLAHNSEYIYFNTDHHWTALGAYYAYEEFCATAGFDAVPGSVKAMVNARGNAMMDQVAADLDVPFKRNGALVVSTKDQDPKALEELLERGRQNGIEGLRIIDRDQLLQMEPNLADDVVCALFAPTGGIVCPFHLTMGYAENAAMNGVEFKLNTQVDQIIKDGDGFKLEVTDRAAGKAECIEAKTVVNAAGVYADVFNNMVSEHKLHIVARKGEYMLLDKSAGHHVSSTIFQLPSAMGKGVLVTPTIHGNLLVGPTAVDVENKEGVNTTLEGLGGLGATAARSVKNVPLNQVITSFAGLRAHEDGDDFIIGEAEDCPGFYNAAGIESPGLSSAPAIGVMVAEMIGDKLSLEVNPDFNPIRRGILDPDTLSLEERNELIRKQPAYGNIICRCEMITEGEILDAIHRPLGARSLDGVKRRTRAGMGRCQSGFCSPRTMEILEREVPMSMYDITKNGIGSNFVVGVNKEI